MIRINLLPHRKGPEDLITRMLVVAAVSLGAVAVVIVVAHLSLSAKITRVERQSAAYNEEIQKLRMDTKDVNKFKAEKEDLQRRLNIIYTLQRAKTGPVKVLDELAKSLPGKLWLTSLKEKDGKMEIKGVAMDNPTIAQFMTALEKTGVISTVELVVSQQLEKKDAKLKEFTLTCQVHYGNAPQKTES
jgi:type IV pilus assembly protein PilN